MKQRLRDLLGEVSFHRGLALGALVGSAIAGSTIWSRLRQARGQSTSTDAGGPRQLRPPAPDSSRTETTPR